MTSMVLPVVRPVGMMVERLKESLRTREGVARIAEINSVVPLFSSKDSLEELVAEDRLMTTRVMTTPTTTAALVGTAGRTQRTSGPEGSEVPVIGLHLDRHKDHRVQCELTQQTRRGV